MDEQKADVKIGNIKKMDTYVPKKLDFAYISCNLYVQNFFLINIRETLDKNKEINSAIN